MSYVFGFVMPVPKASLDAYRARASLAGKVWMRHGALSYVECLADDVPVGKLTSFPRAVQLKDDEVVVLAWVICQDRASYEATLAKVMAEEELMTADMPVDGKRMIFGGFEAIVEL